MTIDKAISVLNEREYLGYAKWRSWIHEGAFLGVSGPLKMLRIILFSEFETITIAKALEKGEQCTSL